MREDIRQLIEDLQDKAKDAPAKVKAYLAERSLVITEAIVTADPAIEGIVKQELENVKSVTALEITEHADAVDAFTLRVFDLAITLAVKALLKI